MNRLFSRAAPFALSMLALAGCACVWYARTGLSYALWSATIVVTVAWFFHHATDPLKFSF